MSVCASDGDGVDRDGHACVCAVRDSAVAQCLPALSTERCLMDYFMIDRDSEGRMGG